MLFKQYLASVFALSATGFAIWYLHRYLNDRERKKLYEAPLKPEWLKLLHDHVPLSTRLPKALERQYHGHINYFIATREFVGRGGFEITDRVRVTIAGNACLLVLTRREPIFPGFKTIIVYPDTYGVHSHKSRDGVVTREFESRAGESWHRGPVVLSWSDLQRGSHNANDARNVVIHEFAHKLDEENQLMDGLPILKERADYAKWAEVLSREYEEFLDRVRRHRNKVIDSYGALSPVEFFAVISETFFEKPKLMKQKLPELYTQLSRYFGVDTADWH